MLLLRKNFQKTFGTLIRYKFLFQLNKACGAEIFIENILSLCTLTRKAKNRKNPVAVFFHCLPKMGDENTMRSNGYSYSLP